MGSIANGRYELAIMLPENDDDAINIAALSLTIASIFSLLLLLPALLLNEEICMWLGNESIKNWIYVVPLAVWLTGCFSVLVHLNNRVRFYKSIAKAQVYKSLTLSIIQLTWGFIKGSGSGLIFGHLASLFVSNYKLLKNVKDKYRLTKISFIKQKEQGLKYIKFPKYSLWAGLANTSSYHFISILISKVYSLTSLGFYSLVERVLGMPSSLIGEAIGKVFYQEDCEEKKQTGVVKNSFNNTIKKLTYIGVPIYTFLFFVVEDVFILVFGGEWALAGQYAQMLIPLFFVRFIVAPLTMMNLIFEKNEVDLIWQCALLILQLGLLAIASFLNFSFESYLTAMVFVISPHYIIMLLIVCRYNK